MQNTRSEVKKSTYSNAVLTYGIKYRMKKIHYAAYIFD